MPNQTNFTQAMAARPWYIPTPNSVELLKELDKDLKKWEAHISDESTVEQVCCVAEAHFDHVRYRFTLRVHAPVEIVPIETTGLPAPYRAILKTHMRARNVLKNFLPVVFDRLVAHHAFHLVSMSGPTAGTDSASYCIWATNTEGGLGLSVVTRVLSDEPLVPVMGIPDYAAAQQVQQAASEVAAH